MNSEKLQRKLLAVARADAPADNVPYAFEKRVAARLHTRPAMDLVGLWSRALWRAAIPCVAIPLLLGFWAVATAQAPGADGGLPQEYDDMVYAAVEQQAIDLEEW